MYVPQFSYPSLADGHLGCLNILALVKEAAWNMGIWIALQDPAFNSFGYLPESRVAGLYALFF